MSAADIKALVDTSSSGIHPINHAQYAPLLEKITDGFIALDADGRIVYVNGEAERINRMRREDMLGRPAWDLFPQAAGTVVQRELVRAWAHRVPVEFENYFDPWKRWFHVKAYPEPDGSLAVFFNDITERKSAESTLRDSEERFRAAVAITPECVTLISQDGTLLHVNSSGLSMLGASCAADVAGRNIYDFVAPEFREAWRAFHQRIVLGEKGSLDFDVIDLQGGRRHVETHAAPLRQSDGSTVQIAITRSITDPKQRERAALLLGAIVDSSDDAIISKDLNGIIMSWNKSATRLFGYTADEVIGKSITILIPADRLDEEPQILSRLRRGERVDHFETIRRRKDGSLLNISLTITPIKDATGTVIGASKIARDVTQIRRAERAALLLSSIVDSSDDAIISKDLNGIITSWNKSAERLFGYTAAEAVGKPITIIIPSERLDEEANIIARLKRGERVDHFETVRRRKDGALLDLSLTISPVKDTAGTVIGASKVARDISERKRTEQAIQALNAQLAADLASMTRMQQLSARMVQADDFPQLLGEIIDAGIEITDADLGSIQLIEDGALRIVAQHGFSTWFLDFFNRLQQDETASGTALQSRQRVIVEDVVESPFFAGTPSRDVMLAAGVRALQATPLISRSGKVLGIFSTHYRTARHPGTRRLRILDILARQAADLIERKRAETELLASEARFRQLADAMPQIVWTANPDGYVDYFNERWYEYTGFPRDRFGDSAWEAILHPEDLERSRETYYAAIRSGQPFRIEYRFWDRLENRWRWFMGRALAVRDGAGRIVKWFGTSTDIDEQKHVQDELRRANNDLEQFAWSASHDLQEPLRSIKIYSELLATRFGSKLDGQGSEFLQYVSTGATRMESLIRDLLEYTQVTRLEGSTEPADANEALAAALANLSGAIAASGATITSDSLPAVRVHSTHLRQLLQNLIGNAIKYRSAERTPRVRVAAEARHGSWLFSVEDNGIGIEPQYKEQIFGLFKRLHSAGEYSGTGIGLAICHRIVERYHGRIWVESEPGRGSTFFFTLPI